jgi:serine/threonine-protein kinase RsbW
MVPQEAYRLDTAHGNYRPEGWHFRAVRSCAEIEPVLAAVVDELTAAGYSRKEIFGVRLALEEAIVNAIKHGHRGDPAKEVRVRFRVGPAGMLAEVEDEGPGFDPNEVPDPLDPDNLERECGRGLLLMRSYMTSVRYNDRGTCVTLCKERAGVPGAAR